MNSEIMQECREKLLMKKMELESRLEKIQASKVRSEPLSADWPEQAQQLENKEVVDALDDFEHEELSKVNMAFGLIENGHYGRCISCEMDIPLSRMKAVPWARHCVACAE